MKTSALALAITLTAFLSSCSSTPEKEAATPQASAPAPTAPVDYGSLTVSPNTGGAHQQAFTVRLQRAPGTPVPALVGLLVSIGLSGGDACYVFNVVGTRRNLLVNDSGAGSQEIGEAPSIGNKQCEILADQSTASVTNDAVTVVFNLRFKPAFKGSKRLYAIAQDGSGVGPGLRPVGQFKVD